MWGETSRHETSSGTKCPGIKQPETKHPWYETEMVQNIQHLKVTYVFYLSLVKVKVDISGRDILSQ